MTLLDRHVAGRFLANFVLLFALLFVFGVSIDAILQLDNFVKAARSGAEAGASTWTLLFLAILDFYGPRVFQFYAYLMGLVAVGAASFTLARMARDRELLAIMAAGTSLLRVGLVILAAATGLNLLQLVNQEVMLPRLAPLLVRTHGDVLRGGVSRFEVPLTRDGAGNLLRIRLLDPTSGDAEGLLFIERDARGAQTARIEAGSAAWDPDAQAYRLDDARRLVRRLGESPEDSGGGLTSEEVLVDAVLRTDLSPKALTIRRYEQFAQMLSLAQLREMRNTGGVDSGLLARLTYLRVGGIVVNLLVLAASLPFFLRREPANHLRQSILCAGFAVPALLGSFVAMSMEMPGIPPAVSVFLPAAILLPIAMWRVGGVKT